jgi:hypothetical protein
MASPNTTPSTGSGHYDSVNKLVEGTAGQNLTRVNGFVVDVVKEYPWTLSKNQELLNEVPYAILVEFAVDESTIQQQISYYGTAVATALEGNTNPLAPYEKLFPRNSTGNVYSFPYFSDINFQVNTPSWQSLDTLEQAQKVAEGFGGLLFGETGANAVSRTIKAATVTAGAALAAAYPKVGIMDRPKLWSSHDFRTIEIKFPLFNTVGPRDWIKNRDLCWQLVNQNLFTKRDFVTGIPPVYYEILIPGQHYSYAASVTNLTIYNRGNMRTLLDNDGGPTIVPDVYEVNITLQDLVMPSQNLFQSIRQKQKDITITNLKDAARNSGNTIRNPALAVKVANTAVQFTSQVVRTAIFMEQKIQPLELGQQLLEVSNNFLVNNNNYVSK